MSTASSEAAITYAIDGALDLIENEKFDFDVPISPTEDLRDRNKEIEDEDEVFFGPVGHKERCVAVNSDECIPKAMSPLSGQQIAELFKEATAVSIYIRNSTNSQTQDYNNHCYEKENENICKILSKSLLGVEQSLPNDALEKDVSTDCPSPEPVVQDNIQDDIPQSIETVKDEQDSPSQGVLVEKNGQGCTNTTFQSPFKARKPRPLATASKFASSKLPKTQMTLTTRSCFNSPINVNQIYGLPNTSPEENKTSVQAQGEIKPPGFGVQSHCRHRKSSSSSVSSTSSASSFQSHDLNETFVISNEQTSGIPSVTNVCIRQAPATKACLKPTSARSTGSKPTFAKPSEMPKNKGRPKPVKALPQPSIVVPSQGKTSQIPNKTSTMKDEVEGGTTPKTNGFVRRQIGLSTSQVQTPNKTHKKIDTPKKQGTPNRQTSIPADQRITRGLTPSARKCDQIATPRRRGSAASSGSSSLPTPVRRQSSTVEGAAARRRFMNSNQGAKGKTIPRPSTPENDIGVPSSKLTPPNQVQSEKPSKRKSLSANGPKRRSLLPTPVKTGLTRSQSHSSKKSSSSFKISGAMLFNMSPSAETKSKKGSIGASQLTCTPVPHRRVSDPFSPGILAPVSPIRDSAAENSAVRNLIDLSPESSTVPLEGKLIDI